MAKNTTIIDDCTHVTVYASGLVCCSVCTDLKGIRRITAAVNLVNPTGIRSQWKKSKDKTFAGGQPNPCPCDKDPKRKHYLFNC